MLNREFEDKVQQKMDELKLTPADAVWQKVEAGLPQKNNRRRWLFFILIIAFIITGSLLLRNYSILPGENPVKNKTVSQENAISNVAIQKNEKTKIVPVTDNISSQAKTSTVFMNKHTAVKRLAAAGIKIKNAYPVDEGNNNDKELNSGERKQAALKTTGLSKAKIKPALPEADDEIPGSLQQTKDINTIPQSVVSVKEESESATHTDSMKLERKDSLILATLDTAKKIIAKKTPEKKQQNKWRYGITTGAGISNVSSGLFKNRSVFADVPFTASTGGPVGSPVFLKPSETMSSLALAAGFYLEKNISKKFTFATGLHYSYQGNRIRVGNRVDSAGIFSVNSTGYYQNGNSVNYKNKFHLLQIPLSFQYKPWEKLPVYAEAGGMISYLIQSNALLYNTSSVYFTDKNAFNKLIFSLSAGAAVNIGEKTKFPFSLGYRFAYSTSSITKSEFGKQHLQNSTLYLNIPLKK